MAEKSADNLIFGIEKSKQIPFENVLFALGIRYVGETVAKKLAKHFKTIKNLQKATFDELILIDEIGERIAKSICDFFKNEQNLEIIETLKQKKLQFEINENQTNLISTLFENKTIVVSGVFKTFSRDEIKNTIEQNGGKVGSSISAKTSFVVAGENMGPAKLEKANSLGIKILTEQDFIKILHEK